MLEIPRLVQVPAANGTGLPLCTARVPLSLFPCSIASRPSAGARMYSYGGTKPAAMLSQALRHTTRAACSVLDRRMYRYPPAEVPSASYRYLLDR